MNMKKFLKNVFIFLGLLIFASNVTVEAAVTSKQDIQLCIDKMETLAKTDFSTLMRKNEVVGLRRSNYEMITYQYIQTVNSQIERFRSYVTRIDAIENNFEISQVEKDNQIQTIYNEAHMSMFDLDTRSSNYIFQLKDTLPTITYQNYAKDFLRYYNDFNMTENDINFRFR